MKAVVWHGTEDVRVDEVPDPTIEEPTDAIVRITSTAFQKKEDGALKVVIKP
jgi:threonine dehydrogenase-like Zn-dependent dehydrogenase